MGSDVTVIWVSVVRAAMSMTLCVAMATFGEYCMHRWWMHRRGTDYYWSHHVEHHGWGHNSKHHMGIMQNANYAKVWIVSLPVQILISCFVWHWHIVLWSVFQAWWFFSWEYVHRSIHDEDGYDWGRWLVPWYRVCRSHHLLHHRRPSTNFGAIFFWSDLVFGTRFRDARGRE